MIMILLEKVVKGLEQHKIPYMLSGSVAMGIYSLPRMTMDIDIIIELQKDSIESFINIFRDNFYIDEQTVKEEVERRGMFNVIDHETGYKIDFVVRKNSEYRRLEFSRRIRAKIGDVYVWGVSPEDLIISKIVWIQQYQSPKQMNDIENLLRIDGIDIDYIKKWCRNLKLNTFDLLK